MSVKKISYKIYMLCVYIHKNVKNVYVSMSKIKILKL